MTPAAQARDQTPKFVCQSCGHLTVSKVLETRGVRRRRECSECGFTFPTLEVLAPARRPPKHRAFVPQNGLPFDSH